MVKIIIRQVQPSNLYNWLCKWALLFTFKRIASKEIGAIHGDSIASSFDVINIFFKQSLIGVRYIRAVRDMMIYVASYNILCTFVLRDNRKAMINSD